MDCDSGHPGQHDRGNDPEVGPPHAARLREPVAVYRAAFTRLHIVKGAHDLFVDRGYAATPMDEIAARAGVAVQTVYYTFRTKG